MVNEQILAALKIGAKRSAAFWKPVYHAETDTAWKSISLDIALDDTVSIAANELGCEVWADGESLMIDDEKVMVQSDAYFALKDAWQMTSHYKVGDKFKKKFAYAVVIRANSRYDVAVMVGNKDCVVEGDDEHIDDILADWEVVTK